MPRTVGRDDVLRLAREGAQLVEVLPREEYDELHLTGAVNIPLRELAERAPAELERTRPVVTYCQDFLAHVQRAADVARADVPTCALDDRVTDVARRVRAEAWPLAVVVNDQRVVLGRLRPRDLAERPEAVAAELMIDGPRTVRGTRPAEDVAAWLDARKVRGVLITSADGGLIGYVRREDVGDPR